MKERNKEELNEEIKIVRQPLPNSSALFITSAFVQDISISKQTALFWSLMPLPEKKPLGRLSANTLGVNSRSRKSTSKSVFTPRRNASSTTPSLADFEIGKVLGKGKLGKVYCAKHKKSGFICAIKVMAKKDLVSLKLQENLRREIEIQKGLVHPYISRLYGFFFDTKNVYLILEYAVHGELYQLLKTYRRFDNVTASNYIYQVSCALRYLHSKGIIHRDIKPENILLSSTRAIKLSDFGWSVQSDAQLNNRRQTVCGTLDYLPPEMVQSQEHDYSVDLWLLGILCYEFLVGRPPFEEQEKNATYKRILKVDLSIPSFVDPEAADLIKRLLQKDLTMRLPLAEVEVHPWIQKYRHLWPKTPLSHT